MQMSSSLVFVSAFLNIGCKEPHKTVQWRIDNFMKMAHTGITIILFCDNNTMPIIQTCIQGMANITLYSFNIETDSWIYNITQTAYNTYCELPETRCYIKDTLEFLSLMQMKIELVAKAIEYDTTSNYTHYAWIDFNLPHVFRNLEHTCAFLNYLGNQHCFLPSFLAAPGCWTQSISPNFNNVCWRFCGGFFIGDVDSLLNMHEKYVCHYENILKQKRVITWEVNMWAELEHNYGLQFTWFKADHNDSIIQLPTYLFTNILSTNKTSISVTYDYPKVPSMYPSSASYIQGPNGEHILVTRYVNYRINPSNGTFIINHKDNRICSVNMMSLLGSDLKTVLHSQIVDETQIGLPMFEGKYMGLEDVRLYRKNEANIGFVASSGSYYKNGIIGIVNGLLDISNCAFVEGALLESPQKSGCEKNWIPLLDECFIYKWSPYTLLHMPDKNMHTLSNVFVPFDKIRGSSVPVWSDAHRCYLAVVHFAEPGNETLQYYHMVVKLTPAVKLCDEHNGPAVKLGNLRPYAWSQPFVFNKPGIQYCIGFTVKNTYDFVFWFSENDGNTQSMHSCSSQFFFVEYDCV